MTIKMHDVVRDNRATESVVLHNASSLHQRSACWNPTPNLSSRLRLCPRDTLAICATANHAQENESEKFHSTRCRRPKLDPAHLQGSVPSRMTFCGGGCVASSSVPLDGLV